MCLLSSRASDYTDMAPYLNYANFNNGWDGIDGHNEGRRLLNDRFLRQVVDQTGAIPYFVNAGKGRFAWPAQRTPPHRRRSYHRFAAGAGSVT